MCSKCAFLRPTLRRDENPLFSAIFEHAEGDPCLQAAEHPPTVDGHRQTPKTAWPPIGLANPSAQVVYRDYALADQAFFSSRMAKAAA